MLCLACAMPGWPLCGPCVASLRRAPPAEIGGVSVEAGFRHVGAAVRLVHNLKYRRSIHAGRILAAAMVAGLPADATALVPIPRSFVRRVTYGIDQARVLATEVSNLTGVGVLDALGALIQRLDRRVAADPEEYQLVAVITDGHENASSDFTRARIAEMVKDRSDAGWAFVFLGANIDSFTEAGNVGMARGQAADWDHSGDGVRECFNALSLSSRQYRSADRPSRLRLKDRLMDEVRDERARESRRRKS